VPPTISLRSSNHCFVIALLIHFPQVFAEEVEEEEEEEEEAPAPKRASPFPSFFGAAKKQPEPEPEEEEEEEAAGGLFAFGTRRIKARAQQSGRVQEQSPAEVRFASGLGCKLLQVWDMTAAQGYREQAVD
jgi:hypothetical protein